MGSEPQQSFQLKWQNYESSLRSVFEKFLTAQAFLDVTLVCNELKINVHKAVLSAASPYLQEILLNNPCPHPIIILQDLDEAGLECLIDFMYRGEIQANAREITALIRCAEALKITGVIDACTRSIKTEDVTETIVLAENETTNSTFDQRDSAVHHVDLDSSGLATTLDLPVQPVPFSGQDDHDVQVVMEEGPCSPGRSRRRKRRRKSAGSTSSADQSSSIIVEGSSSSPSWPISLQPGPMYQSEFEGHGSMSPSSHERQRNPLPSLCLRIAEVRSGLLSSVHSVGEATIQLLDGDLMERSDPGKTSSGLDATVPPQNRSNFGTSTVVLPAVVAGDDDSSGNGNPVARQLYVCQVCNKGLCSKFKLKEHEQIHNPFRQTYSCTHCCRVYQHRTDLYRHHRNIHPDKPPPPHRRQMS